MIIKEAFEYLSSECGIGMKNPFIALRNLVEAFGKVADEIESIPTDYVKKSGDTMTGPLTVESKVTGEEVSAGIFKFEEPVLGGSISFTGAPGFEHVGIQVPNKSGTMVLSSTVENYTTAEHVVGRWIDGKPVYQRTIQGTTSNTNISEVFDIVANDIDTIISCEGIVGWDNGNGDTAKRNLNGYVDSNTYGDWGTNSANTYLIIMYGNYMKNQDYVLTVQYTKTT